MKRKIIRILTVILIVLISVFIFRNTYSKYIEDANGTWTVDVADWFIKVNTEDIVNNTTFAFDGRFHTVESDPTVVDGAIAPGLKADFLIIPDTRGSDVPVILTTTIDVDSLIKLAGTSKLKVKDIKYIEVSSITDDAVTYTEGDSVAFTKDENNLVKITDIRYLNVADADVVIPHHVDDLYGYKIIVEWEDSTDPNDMLIDYEIASSGIDLHLPISVNALQYYRGSVTP